MKPKPLSSLNHLTAPVPITSVPTSCASRAGTVPALFGRNLSRREPRKQPLNLEAIPSRSSTCKGGFAGSHFQEGPDGAPKVLGVEQRPRDARHRGVRLPYTA